MSQPVLFSTKTSNPSGATGTEGTGSSYIDICISPYSAYASAQHSGAIAIRSIAFLFAPILPFYSGVTPEYQSSKSIRLIQQAATIMVVCLFCRFFISVGGTIFRLGLSLFTGKEPG